MAQCKRSTGILFRKGCAAARLRLKIPVAEVMVSPKDVFSPYVSFQTEVLKNSKIEDAARWLETVPPWARPESDVDLGLSPCGSGGFPSVRTNDDPFPRSMLWTSSGLALRKRGKEKLLRQRKLSLHQFRERRHIGSEESQGYWKHPAPGPGCEKRIKGTTT
eukprot:1154674-Pelagomonas_calceolata.AAC.3